MQKGSKRAGYEIAKAIDTSVNTHFQDLTATWAGTDGQTFTDDILIDLMEGLDEAEVPRSGRSLVVDPSVVADTYKIDKFMTYDYSRKPFQTDGFVGTIPAYNIPVFVTNNLSQASTGAYAALLHTEAIGLVIQKTPNVQQYRWEPRHSTVINVDCIWGDDVVRSTFGAEFFTRKL